MNKRRWLALAAGLGTPLIYYALQTRGLRKQIGNLRDFDMPSARLYDAFWGSIYAGFYERVAGEVAKEYPKGRILEVGSGPGRLALQIALAAPEVEITGVDIAADMIERAKGLVEAEGLADRVRFEIGDVSSLPYPDGQFDLVVSTLSLHHWPDPALGLLEIQRVIKPRSEAWIYDISDWALKLWRGLPDLAQLAPTSSKGSSAKVETIVRFGPLPLVNRLRMKQNQ